MHKVRGKAGLTAVALLSGGFGVTASAAFAEDANTVFIHASYLSEPTEWCAVDQGVPVVIKVDGPDVFVGEFNKSPTKIRVSRGGGAKEFVDVSPTGVTEIRSRHGTRGTFAQSIEPRVDDLVLLGRMYAELQVCDTFWSQDRGDVSWSVQAPDGSVVRSGEIENKRAFSNNNHPLFYLGTDFPKAVKLDDQTFVLMSEPQYVRTTEAFVSAEEVQAE